MPVLYAERLRQVADVDAGIVEQNIDAPEAARDARNGGGNLLGLRNIPGQDVRLRPRLLLQRAGGLAGRVRIAADDCHARPACISPRTMPRPMPPLPPVTMATLPVKSKGLLMLSSTCRVSRGTFLVDELDDVRNQLGRDDHYGLVFRVQGSLNLRGAVDLR